MGLSAEDMAEITAVLAASGAGAVAQLRQRFPALSFTRCDASDVGETPYATCGSIDLHLLDNSDHCARLTADPASATGLVLAQRKAAP